MRKDDENSSFGKRRDKQKLECLLREGLASYSELASQEELHKREQDLRERFIELVGSTTKLGDDLSNYRIRTSQKEVPSAKVIAENSWFLYFSGFLEGDFAERAHFPISLFGGFFVRTPHASILFDPGTGTRAGLRDMGVDVALHTDIIVVSHYHYSVRYDLHLTLNEMGAFRPDGRGQSLTKTRQIPFLSTEAVIDGRNGHPSVITPSYGKVIAPMVVKPGATFRITRLNGSPHVETCEYSAPVNGGTSLLLRTFPAYHDEVAQPDDEHDLSAYGGREVCSYYLTDGRLGVFFTGDTEYREDDFKRDLEDLQGQVDVLIVNMKTIEYLAREERGHADIDPENLRLTQNQLGFEGVKRLALLLDPRVLVIRALGLECVVQWNEGAGTLRYTPEKLVTYREYMSSLLSRMGARKDMEIVIPIRHEIKLSPRISAGGEARIHSRSLVPAIPSHEVATFGDDEGFVTGNRLLINRINSSRHILETDKRPFIVIQGESGCGKSFLADSIAFEIRKKDLKLSGKKLSDRNVRKIKKGIEHFDLGLAGSDKNLFLAQLLGCVKDYFGKHYPGDKGMLGTDGGILILNQLEKLPPDLSKTFLDILEEWQYKPLSRDQAPEPFQVKVKIIFTTNEEIDNQKLLAEDLRNRLRGRCVTIPYLRSLSLDERNKELSLFINNWCRREKVALDTASWDILLKADLSKGAVRCLRNLLEKARFFAEEKHAIYKVEGEKPIVFISDEEVRQAMKENGVGLMSEIAEGEKLGRAAAWVAAIWISHRCVDSRTYTEMHPGMGKSMEYFKLRLSPLKTHFWSPLEAWNFMDTPAALQSLETEGLESYIDRLGVSDESVDAGDLFVSGSDRQWLERRGDELISALKDRKTKEAFIKKIGKLQH